MRPDITADAIISQADGFAARRCQNGVQVRRTDGVEEDAAHPVREEHRCRAMTGWPFTEGIGASGCRRAGRAPQRELGPDGDVFRLGPGISRSGETAATTIV